MAGTGTGKRPCIVSTVPLPSGGGAETTSGWPSSSSASAAPQTSTMLSTAPTSWKRTDSSGTSWIFASARPMTSKTARAWAFARGGSALASMRARISPSPRCTCGTSEDTSTFRCTPAMACRTARVTSKPQPSSPSVRRPDSSAFRSTPRSSIAARNMSPAMPPTGSR